jgi:transposase
MMGRLEAGQARLFYHFRLEDQIPANHLLRKLDALLDFDMLRKQLEPFYSEIGRPSVDPELMIRMLLIGYCYSIRSERRLCDEVRFKPRLQVVLRAWPRSRSATPFDVLGQPPWPLP